MNKGKLTVEKDSKATVKYFNSKGDLHNPHGPALVKADGSKAYYINDKKLTKAEFKSWQSKR